MNYPTTSRVVVAGFLYLAGLAFIPCNGAEAQPVAGTTFTYQGSLGDSGVPADGVFDFQFTLYSSESGLDRPVAGPVEIPGVAVAAGLFTVEIDFGPGMFDGDPRWLEIGVKLPRASIYTFLSPRQNLTPVPYAHYAVSASPVAHDHWGESWSGGGVGLRLTSSGIYGLDAETASTGGSAVYGTATSPSGVCMGVRGVSESSSGRGVVGVALAPEGFTFGVYGQSYSNEGHGVYGITDKVPPPGTNIAGVLGRTSASGSGSHGVMGRSDNSNGAGVYAYHNGSGVALRVNSYSGDPIEGYSGNPSAPNRVFRVANNGNVYADGTYSSPAADFAEMLPAAEGLEPGDVLVVDANGELARSTEAGQSSVVGVYSTAPGFLGGSSEEETAAREAPLAIMGIVPVKAVSENGSIRPGDLLVTSSVPGHAMKAGEAPKIGTVIGKALQGLEGENGTISMLVMLQ